MPENIVLEETEMFTVESRASKLVSVTEMLAAIENLRKRVVNLETERDKAERAEQRRLERLAARAAAPVREVAVRGTDETDHAHVSVDQHSSAAD